MSMPNPSPASRRDVKDDRPNRTHPAVMFGSGFAVAVGLFGWLGHRWDEKTGWEPLGVLLGISLGFAYGAYEVWKFTRLSGDTPSPPPPPEEEKQEHPPQ